MKGIIFFLMMLIGTAGAATARAVICPDYLSQKQNYLFNAGLTVGKGNNPEDMAVFQEIVPDDGYVNHGVGVQSYHLEQYITGMAQIFLICVYNNGQSLDILLSKSTRLCIKKYDNNRGKNSPYIILFSCS